MNIVLEDILSQYINCQFYDEHRLTAVRNGDIIELGNIGTDFARSGMFEYAVNCWLFIINNDLPTNPETYTNLGVSYYYGNGVDQNYEKAVHYYQKAAAKGHPFGLYNLGVALENGNGIGKDIDRAVECYTKAAEKHVNQAIDALIRLGLYDELYLQSYQRNFNDNSFSGN